MLIKDDGFDQAFFSFNQVHFFFTKNIFLTKLIFWPGTFFDQAHFVTKHIFLPRTFFDQAHFLTRLIFWSSTFSDQAHFWPGTFFDQAHFLTKHIFWPGTFFDPAHFLNRHMAWGDLGRVEGGRQWHWISMARPTFQVKYFPQKVLTQDIFLGWDPFYSKYSPHSFRYHQNFLFVDSFESVWVCLSIQESSYFIVKERIEESVAGIQLVEILPLPLSLLLGFSA